MQQSLAQLFSHLQNISAGKKVLYLLSFMLFFWALFDGVLGYLVPIIVTDVGISKTEMGIIFGSSSIFGGVFDFLISKYFNNANFRRIYLLMFATCMLYPFFLWQGKSVWMFLIAMALWGLYYDLQNFGNLDFVGTKVHKEEHASHFGILIVFKSLGYLLAPLIAGLLIGATVIGANPFIFSWVVLCASFVFFIFFLLSIKPSSEEFATFHKRPMNIILEFRLWKVIGKLLVPVLILTVLLNVLDAFFWTIGPLLAESLQIHPFNGLFMTAYLLPPLFVGWFVGKVAKKIGKKRTGFLAFLVGSLLLLPLFLLQNPFAIILLVFISSISISLAWPSINGAYADYVNETSAYEKEIEGLEDFATNIGYAVGPMLAGFLADQVGNLPAFSLFSVVGVVVSIYLLIYSPRSITIKV